MFPFTSDGSSAPVQTQFALEAASFKGEAAERVLTDHTATVVANKQVSFSGNFNLQK